MITRIKAALQKHLGEQQARAGDEVMGEIKKTIILQSLDEHWREHLRRLEHLRQVIGLRGYGQRDPLNEYKTESFSLFEGMLGEIRQDVTRHLARLEIRRAEEMPELPSSQALPEMTLHHPEAENASAPPEAPTPQPARPLQTRAQGWGKVGRNAPLPLRIGQKIQTMSWKELNSMSAAQKFEIKIPQKEIEAVMQKVRAFSWTTTPCRRLAKGWTDGFMERTGIICKSSAAIGKAAMTGDKRRLLSTASRIIGQRSMGRRFTLSMRKDRVMAGRFF